MLKPYGYSWEKTRKDRKKEASEYEAKALLTIRRTNRLYSDVKKTFPKEVNAMLWMSNGGSVFITAVIVLRKDAPPEDTITSRRYLAARYGKATRTFNDYEGEFTWKGYCEKKDKQGKYQEAITIQNTDPGKCEITKYQETVTRFKTNCTGSGDGK